MLSSVSHDLRTPLTTILAALAELQAPAAATSREIAAIEGEAQRLNRFVANLLDMVRIEAGALNLYARAGRPDRRGRRAPSHDLRAALAGHPLKLDVSPDLPLVRVDPQLLHHCLINLLDNAAKYSPIRARRSLVAAQREPDGIKLQVIDEGSGLPPGEEARMFETFTRLAGSDRTGGTGLGLAIVKGFAEAMGLTVAAANRDDGDGAIFTLRLSRRPASSSERDAAMSGERRSWSSTTSPRSAACCAARWSAPAMRWSRPPTRARRWPRSTIDKPDAVLLDLGLPDRDGLELVPLIKAQGRGAAGRQRARRDRGEGRRARSWRRRLCHQAVRHRGSAGPRPHRAAPAAARRQAAMPVLTLGSVIDRPRRARP